MSTVLRFAAAAILVCATGCADSDSLRSISAGHVGCTYDEIEVSDESGAIGSRRWTATCRGQTYYCSANQAGYGLSYACTPAASTGSTLTVTASANPSPLAGSNSGEAPRGAAGFTFGAGAGAAQQLCTDAGLTFKALPEDRFSCSGAPSDVGFPVATIGRLCDGKLCAVSIDAAREGTWPQLAERFAKLRSSLAAKYGSPAAQATDALDDCTDDVSSCFAKGRIKTHAAWRWPNGQVLNLTLSGGVVGARPALWVIYRKPADAPKADAL